MGGSAFSSFWSFFTLDTILRFPTQKYIVIKDRTLVCFLVWKFPLPEEHLYLLPLSRLFNM